MDVEADRRVLADRRGAPPSHELSEAERIEAAQFLLSTRQREEAAMRATHLRGEHTPEEDEEHGRETLVEMINLQEAARSATTPPGRDRKRRDHSDLSFDDESSSRVIPSSLVRALVLALLLGALLLVAWQLQAS